ncbi:hypothetical protein [Mucilaginibacter panaciglaebae]
MSLLRKNLSTMRNDKKGIWVWLVTFFMVMALVAASCWYFARG